MVKDPVCGMDLDPEGTEHFVTYQGETYYFCSLACQEAFLRDPQTYVESVAASLDGVDEPRMTSRG